MKKIEVYPRMWTGKKPVVVVARDTRTARRMACKLLGISMDMIYDSRIIG